jgi:hypothetical protein
MRISLSLLLMANVNAKNTDQEAQKIIAEQLKAVVVFFNRNIA